MRMSTCQTLVARPRRRSDTLNMVCRLRVKSSHYPDPAWRLRLPTIEESDHWYCRRWRYYGLGGRKSPFDFPLRRNAVRVTPENSLAVPGCRCNLFSLKDWNWARNTFSGGDSGISLLNVQEDFPISGGLYRRVAFRTNRRFSWDDSRFSPKR